MEVVEHEDVRLVAGSNRSEVPEPVVASGIDGRHHQGVLRADALGDGHPHHLVDVALLDDESGFAVVGAEHAALGAVSLDEGEQVAQVAGDGSLAQHHPHPEASFLQGLFVGCRLMVGADSRCYVGVESWATNTGRVTVDMVREACRELGHLGLVAGDDTWKVHHLRHADRPVAAQKALDVTRGEGSAR